jgi:hypothetical protein
MALRIVVFVLAVSMVALAQRPAGAGKPAGAGAGAGAGAQQGRPADAGRPSQAGRPEPRPGSAGEAETQKQEGKQKGEAKREEQARGKGKDGDAEAGSAAGSGAYKMLQRKTGKSEEELRAMYEASGVKNFGQFVSAMVASQNLGMDSNLVLSQLGSKSLGQIIQEQKGLSPEQARAEIARAQREARQAGRISRGE